MTDEQKLKVREIVMRYAEDFATHISKPDAKYPEGYLMTIDVAVDKIEEAINGKHSR